MTESIQENMEELFSLSADELQLRLDKIESGHHTLFKWDGDECPDYPRFVEKVIFQPKKCNVEFPPIGPRAFSRGVRSTSSLPDIRNTDLIEIISNEGESTRSIVVEKKRKRSKKKTKPRFSSPVLNIREPHVQDQRPLFCEGKGFVTSNNSKVGGSPSKIAVDKVRLVNLVSKPDAATTGLPKIHDINSTKLQKTQVGPWFRAWSTQKKEKSDVQEFEKNTKDLDLHLDVIEQKAVRSFDLDGLLKEARRHQTPKEKNQVDEMSLNSAATYVAKIKQQLDLSTKGGGFVNRTKHISVRDEIHIKKMLRQKLFSFYDFGGSANAFERVVSDVCSKKNPSVMFKNLPAYETTEQQDIFPLAAPHTNLPLLPNSPTHLQNLYHLLDTFPWFSWQQRCPDVKSEVIRGSPQIKPRSCSDVEKEIALSDFEDEWETNNPKLEVRLPSCVA